MTSVQVLEDRKYTKDHEWAKQKEGKICFGVSAFAVDQLGDITLVGLDVGIGDEVKAGEAFGTIESVKTLSDLYAPVSGKVVAINEALENEPELINEDPWEKGWMIAIEPSNWDDDSADMLDHNAYRGLLEASDH